MQLVDQVAIARVCRVSVSTVRKWRYRTGRGKEPFPTPIKYGVVGRRDTPNWNWESVALWLKQNRPHLTLDVNLLDVPKGAVVSDVSV